MLRVDDKYLSEKGQSGGQGMISITHSESYTLSPDAPKYMQELIKKRMLDRYGF